MYPLRVIEHEVFIKALAGFSDTQVLMKIDTSSYLTDLQRRPTKMLLYARPLPSMLMVIASLARIPVKSVDDSQAPSRPDHLVVSWQRAVCVVVDNIPDISYILFMVCPCRSPLLLDFIQFSANGVSDSFLHMVDTFSSYVNTIRLFNVLLGAANPQISDITL